MNLVLTSDSKNCVCHRLWFYNSGFEERTPHTKTGGCQQETGICIPCFCSPCILGQLTKLSDFWKWDSLPQSKAGYMLELAHGSHGSCVSITQGRREGGPWPRPPHAHCAISDVDGARRASGGRGVCPNWKGQTLPLRSCLTPPKSTLSLQPRM